MKHLILEGRVRRFNEVKTCFDCQAEGCCRSCISYIAVGNNEGVWMVEKG